MTDFVVTITDPAELSGITWAREAHNAAIPQPPPDVMAADMEPQLDTNGMPIPGTGNGQSASAFVADPTQVLLATDEEYVQWLVGQAAASYAIQQEQEAWRQAYTDAQAAGRSRQVTPPPLSFRSRTDAQR